MERAFRLLDPENGLDGGSETVTVATLREWGREKSREHTYCCPEPECQVYVGPVFPNPDRRIRNPKKVPQPHFRALKARNHEDNCKYGCSGGDATRTSGSNSGFTGISAYGAKAPSIFLESSQRPTSKNANHALSDLTKVGSQLVTGSNAVGERESISSAWQLSTLTGFWHADSSGMASHALKVKDCPSRTYGGVFKELGPQTIRELSTEERYVYWSSCPTILRYGRYFSIRFNLYKNNKQVTFWLKSSIDDELLLPDFVARLDNYKTKPVTVYALGRFQQNLQKCIIELVPESVHHVWAEFGVPLNPALSTE